MSKTTKITVQKFEAHLKQERDVWQGSVIVDNRYRDENRWQKINDMGEGPCTTT